MWALRDRPRRDGLARRPAGEDDRGDRSEAAGRVHRRREAHDRDARSRARGRRAPRRPEPQARGALDHQAPRRARPARALRQRGALHAHPLGARRLDEDRVRRHDGRGAVLRRVGHRSGRRPRARHAHRGADGRLVRHGRLARVVRGGRGRADLAGDRRQGARQRGRAGRRWSACSTRPRPTCTRCSTTNRHLVVALRDELLRARGARRRRDHRRAARGREASRHRDRSAAQ